VKVAGRSQPGHTQCLSRASSALRAWGESSRLRRPKSITTPLPSSTKRRSEAPPQTNRSTVSPESKPPHSVSAAGEPARPSRVSKVQVTTSSV